MQRTTTAETSMQVILQKGRHAPWKIYPDELLVSFSAIVASSLASLVSPGDDAPFGAFTVLSTLPPPLNTQPRPIEAPSPLVHWCLSSRLPLVRRLVVASPVVACLRLASHFFGQPPHASILDPSSLFTPAGCCVASLRTASTSQRAGAIAGVIKCTAPVQPPARRKAPPTPLQ